MTAFTTQQLIDFTYIAAAIGFILALKWLSSPVSAMRGVLVGEIASGIAVLATLFDPQVTHYKWIIIALVIGAAIGVPLGMVKMTAVPQRTALSHAFGALSAAMIGIAEYYVSAPNVPKFEMAEIGLEVIIGSLTVTGSLIAAGKLQEILPQRPITYKGQNFVSLSILSAAIILMVILVFHPEYTYLFPIMVAAALLGFVLNSKVLVVAGALDGASGFILSVIMCKAMNRSFTNVLFGAFGQVQAAAAGAAEDRTVRSASAEEAAAILAAANKVVVVPGYGMAVAQAQHKVRELYDSLTKKGIDVKFAIHPVAGRMPGHMNVLLAEADIPYDKLVDMEDINGEFPQTDVALIIGANDVTNPAARTDTSSPIYGMPILDVDKARTVMVIKRSMAVGFAGIDNPLYYMDKTLMLFGDAKGFVGNIVRELTGSGGH